METCGQVNMDTQSLMKRKEWKIIYFLNNSNSHMPFYEIGFHLYHCIQKKHQIFKTEGVRAPTLQRQFRLYIPFLGIARPQPLFPQSCVCERFIYSQDRSTYFLQQKRQTHRGNIKFVHRHMTVEIGTETPIFLFWEYLFQIFVFAVCMSMKRKSKQ